MWQAYANPKRFLDLSAVLLPWTGGLAVFLLVVGGLWALLLVPQDYQQGDTVRIMYVHVPAAWMAMAGYVVMAGAAIVGFVYKHPVADVTVKAAAPIGAAFTALALATGSLWGRPMWGTWWEWDARMTSVLVLLFQYLGVMALWAAIEEPQRAARAAGILAIVGLINIPIIRFSVDWWNTLHQPASVIRMDGPTIHSSMLWPLLVMGLAYTALFAWILLVRVRTEIHARRARTLKLQRAGAV